MAANTDLLKVCGGEPVATKPTIDWPGDSGLVEIVNPYGMARASGADLTKQLTDDPHGGSVTLEFWVQVVQESIDKAFNEGAFGILYRLHGACARHTTPMQYGGYFLEHDRLLLQHAMDRGFVALFVVGGEETFLDVVSDLPAHAIGWDVEATGYSLDAMREMRDGATFTSDERSEIGWRSSRTGESLIEFLEGGPVHA